jgi:hypothetical protein
MRELMATPAVPAALRHVGRRRLADVPRQPPRALPDPTALRTRQWGLSRNARRRNLRLMLLLAAAPLPPHA